jgi:ferredoxin-nitrite reductase
MIPPAKPNRIERLKAQMLPAAFADRLMDVDWGNVDESSRFYLKNFGIYNIKMRPDVYMLRLRFDGGHITKDQLAAVGQLSRTYGLEMIVTARAQLELHGIAPAKIAAVYAAVHAAGIMTHQTLTDNIRAMTTDPYDGAATDSRIEVSGIITALQERLIGQDEWIGTLPRKFNIAIIGREIPMLNPWGNDLLLALALRDGIWGFNLYLGGKNTETAQDADLFIPPEAAVETVLAVLQVFRADGLRGSRSKNRLFHLIVAVGMETVRARILEELPFVLSPAGTLKMEPARYRTDTPLRCGDAGVIDTDNGVLRSEQITALLSLTAQSQVVLRLGGDQNVHLLGLREPLSSAAQPLTVCAGSRYCAMALWELKHDAPWLPLERLNQLGVSVGMSGCLKACGRHYHNDIGLLGLRTNLYGDTERAIRLYLGAIQGQDAQPARLIYYSVPERCISDLLRDILDDFERGRYRDFAEFSSHWRRYSVDFLQLWYLARGVCALDGAVQEAFDRGSDERVMTDRILEACRCTHNDTEEVIRVLSHRLWDQPRKGWAQKFADSQNDLLIDDGLDGGAT